MMLTSAARRRQAAFQPPSDLAAYLRVAALVATLTGLPADSFTFCGRRLCSRPKGAARSRQMAHLMTIYLTVTALNIRAARVARAAGMQRCNVSRLVRRAEDLRDDPAFDALLERLETRLAGV